MGSTSTAKANDTATGSSMIKSTTNKKSVTPGLVTVRGKKMNEDWVQVAARNDDGPA